MRFGVTIFATDRSMDPVELAVEAEARGFDSLYLPEHTHIPVSRRTPAPTGDAELPEEYRRTLDPFVVLAAAAQATDRLTVGTGIALVAQRDAITTAKAAATLDRLSGGRFVLGIGFGWNREEMADHGIDYGRRREVVRETMLAMRTLWSDDVAGFEGEFISFEPSWQFPKPHRSGGPTVLLGGGAGPKLFSHIVEYTDGWIPIGGAGLTAAIPTLQQQWSEAGRAVDDLHVVPFGSLPSPEKLDHFARIGVTEVVFRLPSADRDSVLPILEEQAGLLSDAP